MNFKQALESLLQGKKIRRSCWIKGNYWHLNKEGRLINSIGENPIINKFQIMDKDTWEVYKDDKEELKNKIKEFAEIYSRIFEILGELK